MLYISFKKGEDTRKCSLVLCHHEERDTNPHLLRSPMMKALLLHFIILVIAITLLCFSSTGYAVPANDDFADATAITGTTGTTSGNNIEATAETGEPNYINSTFDSTPDKTVWFKWKAPSSDNYTFNTFGDPVTGNPFDTILAVYTGTAVDNLTWVNDNDDYEDNTLVRFQSRLSFDAVAGTTYYISVDGVGIGHTAAEGYFALNRGLTSAIQANDSFSSPEVITDTTGSTTGTSINATPEELEPNHITGEQAYSSLWFDWTAPFSGEYVFGTFESDFDTVMAVYTGTAFDSLTKIVENDDASVKNRQSRVSFTAAAMTTYHIVVDGYRGLQGDVSLNWQPLPSLPPNDNFANATVITGESGKASAYTFLATTETDESSHGDSGGPYKSIWFAWTAPFTGKANFNTYGSDYDTTMAAYTGTAVGSLSQKAANDDAAEGIQSRISFQAIKDTTYYIAVDGYNGTEGNVVLNWDRKSLMFLFIPAIISGGMQP